MTALAAALVGLLLVVLLACVKPLGLYMANIFDGRPIWPLRALGLEPDPRRPRYLVTETGLGYRLRVDEEAAADGAHTSGARG
jgi:hypothetical protein